jgi:hypothetical protein
MSGGPSAAVMAVLGTVLAACGPPGGGQAAAPESSARPGATASAAQLSPAPGGAGTTPSPGSSPATSAAATRIISAATASFNDHGPYHAIIVLRPKGATQGKPLSMITMDAVPPDRAHLRIGPPGAPVEVISIGRSQWTRKEDNTWSAGGTTEAPQQPSDLMPAKDVVAVTERTSADPALREFAVTVRGQAPGSPMTVIVDRKGWLRVITVGTAQGVVTFTYSYDRRIAIPAPAHRR